MKFLFWLDSKPLWNADLLALAAVATDPLRAWKGIFWACIFGVALWVIIGYAITVMV